VIIELLIASIYRKKAQSNTQIRKIGRGDAFSPNNKYEAYYKKRSTK